MAVPHTSPSPCAAVSIAHGKQGALRPIEPVENNSAPCRQCPPDIHVPADRGAGGNYAVQAGFSGRDADRSGKGLERDLPPPGRTAPARGVVGS